MTAGRGRGSGETERRDGGGEPGAEPTAVNGGLRRRRIGGTSYLVGGDGEAVVFLHGTPGSALAWLAVAGRLRDRYLVVVPDLRGFGRSHPPQGDWYVDGQAAAMTDLLDALGVDACVLVGHDFGALVAVGMLHHAPDRRVTGLVLVAPEPFTAVPLPSAVAHVPLFGRVCLHLLVGTRFGARRRYEAGVVRTETATWPDFQRHLTSSGLLGTRRVLQRWLAAGYGNGIDRARAARVPTLLLWGGADRALSVDEGKRLEASLPGSELVVYPETGHFVPEERPAAVAADIERFLRRRRQ